MPTKRISALFLGFLCAQLTFGAAPEASAQQSTQQSMQQVSEARGAGFELAVSQAPTLTPGAETMLVSAMVFSTHGVVGLAVAPEGTPVQLTLVAYQPQRDRPGTYQQTSVVQARAQVGAGGELRVELPVRDLLVERFADLRLVLRVGMSSKTFTMGVNRGTRYELDLLTDRNRYEAGETLHAWLRARTADTHEAAHVSARVVLYAMNQQQQPVYDAVVQTRASGAASADITLPSTLAEGSYSLMVMPVPPSDGTTLYAQPFDGPSKQIQIGRRTFERMLAQSEVARPVVPPGQTQQVRVSVATPSGNPIRSAQVSAEESETGASLQGVTDENGVVTFTTTAISNTNEDVALRTLQITISHPAYGSLRTQATYRVSRVPMLLEARASNGALVPETQSEIMISATRPDGVPLPANTELRVSGPALAGATRTVRTDANGFALVPLRLRATDVVFAQAGACAGRPSTAIDVSVDSPSPRTARLCVPVAQDATVRVAINAPIMESTVGFSIERRPISRDARVFVELLNNRGELVDARWLGSNESRGELNATRNATGVFYVRARAVRTFDPRASLAESSPTLFYAGATDAVLMRPASAFDLSLSADRDPYNVRETASVIAHASPLAATGDSRYLTLVARDLAAHGGETDWVLDLVANNIALVAETREQDMLALRAALFAALHGWQDPVPVGVPPIDVPAWGHRDDSGGGTQIARDPVYSAAALLRQQLRQYFVNVETQVAQQSPREADFLEPHGSSYAFRADALQRMGLSPRVQSEDEGVRTITIASLHEADPNFDFDHVARRITRARLTRLLGALAALTDPDNTPAARVLETTPYARWLGLLSAHAGVEEDALLDAWGRPFELRAARGRARFVLSERAPDVELVSAGADARFGTGDDVRDPFERVLPRGSLYAIGVGEDELMKRLAVIAPGRATVAGMLSAYDAVSIAMLDEARGVLVGSSGSELEENLRDRDSVQEGFGDVQNAPPGVTGMGTIGHGGGFGYGRGMGAAPTPMMRMAADAEVAEQEMERRAQEPFRMDTGHASLSSRFDALGERARERFPATLAFVAEVPLTGESTRIDIPLADALTTYRVEAIAWSTRGWTSQSRTLIHVDQPAVVDAPIPPLATQGDVLHVPLRVSNRTDHDIELTLRMQTDGTLALGDLTPRVVRVPAHDAIVDVVTLTCATIGEGRITLRALDSDGHEIDAVSRSMRVRQDLREAVTEAESLVSSQFDVRLTLPPTAQTRDASTLQLIDPFAFFGANQDVTIAADPLSMAWLHAMAGRTLTPTLANASRNMLSRQGYESPYEIPLIARAIGALWDENEVVDDAIEPALVRIAAVLGASSSNERIVVPPNWSSRTGIDVLIGLAPAMRQADRRARLAEGLALLSTRIRKIIAEQMASVTNDAELLSYAAYALALTHQDDDRADELLRRAERSLVRFDDAAFVDVPSAYRAPYLRLAPSAALALAKIERGDSSISLSVLRDAIMMRSSLEAWSDGLGRALTTWLAVRVGGRLDASALRVFVDDEAVALRAENGVFSAASARLAQPGTHTLRVEGLGDAIAFAHLTLRYGVPWSEAPAAEAPIGLTWSGQSGVRDDASGLALTVRNRGPRTLQRPIVEIDLPTGAELDEHARAALSTILRSPPEVVEGGRLRLTLRSLAPSAWVRIALPVRWTVSGTLQGLGVAAYDASQPLRSVSRPVAILASRSLQIADEGPRVPSVEQEQRDPVPDPIPLPVPVARPEVLR